MKMISRNRGRFATVLSVIVVTAALVACGGGGGSSSTVPPVTPPTPPAKPTIGPLEFATPSGSTLQKNAAVSIRVANLTGSISSLKVTVPTATCNSAPVTLLVAPFTVNGNTATSSITTTGDNGQACTSQISVVASGPDGDSTPSTGTFAWNVEAAKKLIYTDIVLSYYGVDNGFARKHLPDGSYVVAVNKTRYNGMLSCWPADKPNADGTIPSACAAQFGSDRYYDIYLDPVAMEYKNSISAPTGVSYVQLNAGASRVPPGHPTWRTADDFENGDYAYIDQANSSVLRRLSTAGADSVIYAGTFEKDNSCSLVMIFSNR